MTEDELVTVTMTHAAAERFIAALVFAEARIWGETSETAMSYGEWLRWGIGRVSYAADIKWETL